MDAAAEQEFRGTVHRESRDEILEIEGVAAAEAFLHLFQRQVYGSRSTTVREKVAKLYLRVGRTSRSARSYHG